MIDIGLSLHLVYGSDQTHSCLSPEDEDGYDFQTLQSYTQPVKTKLDFEYPCIKHIV